MANSIMLISSSPSPSNFSSPVARYVEIACLTLCVWDWMISISDEVQMIRHGGKDSRHLKFLLVLYYTVRVCPIIYLMTVFKSGPHPAVVATQLVVNIIILPAASALFFIRLRAVYFDSKYVVGFFAVLWLVILFLFVYDSALCLHRCIKLPRPLRCIAQAPIAGYAFLATAIYDTLLYLTISWKLASFATSERWRDRLKSFVTGSGLGYLSKILLQSGQLYYFVIISFDIWTIAFKFGMAGTRWEGLPLPPTLTLACIMSCRLFRELKLGLLDNPTSGRELSSFMCRDISTALDQPTANGTQSGHEIGLHTVEDPVPSTSTGSGEVNGRRSDGQCEQNV